VKIFENNDMAKLSLILHQDVTEKQLALINAGCEPSWDVFCNSYAWFCLTQKLSVKEQDIYQDLWLRSYNYIKKNIDVTEKNKRRGAMPLRKLAGKLNNAAHLGSG